MKLKTTAKSTIPKSETITLGTLFYRKNRPEVILMCARIEPPSITGVVIHSPLTKELGETWLCSLSNVLYYDGTVTVSQTM